MKRNELNVQKPATAEMPRPGEDYLRPLEAAEYTGLSTSMLAKLRMRSNRGVGPNFIKVSGCVLYRRTDLDDWLHGHVIGGEV